MAGGAALAAEAAPGGRWWRRRSRCRAGGGAAAAQAGSAATAPGRRRARRPPFPSPSASPGSCPPAWLPGGGGGAGSGSAARPRQRRPRPGRLPCRAHLAGVGHLGRQRGANRSLRALRRVGLVIMGFCSLNFLKEDGCALLPANLPSKAKSVKIWSSITNRSSPTTKLFERFTTCIWFFLFQTLLLIALRCWCV